MEALRHGSYVNKDEKIRIQWSKDEARELLQKIDHVRTNFNPPQDNQYRQQAVTYRDQPRNYARRRNDNRRHSGVPETYHEEEIAQRPKSHFSHTRREPRRKKHFPKQSEQVSSAKARKWEDLLVAEAELFNYANSCVLVQNVPESASNQSIQLFFENERRSGGGEVYMLCKVRDRVLVVFVDAQVARKVSEKDDLCFEGNRLETFFKPFPTQFKDRFVLSGLSPKTSMETLEMYIEDCCPNKSVPGDVEKISVGKFMVIYDNGEDIRAIMRGIEQKKLEDCILKTKVVCRSDCVRVANIGKDVKDDTIKLFFQSKRRTDGGSVTLLDRSDEHVLVYFADYQDAERVVAKCKENSPKLSGKTINVALHYPGLEENQTSSNRRRNNRGRKAQNASNTKPVAQGKPAISYKITVKKENLEKVEWIRKSSKIQAQFEKIFDDVAHVRITAPRDANSVVSIMVQPLQTPNEKYVKQSKFESECSRRYGNFLKTIATCTTHVDNKILKGIRSSNSWEDGNSHVITVDGQVDVLVRWKSGCVDITGLKDELSIAQEFFKPRSKVVEESVPLQELKFRAFVDCKIIADLQEKYLQRVEIMGQHNCIHLKGNTMDVDDVRNEILTLVTNLESTKLCGLDDRTVEFIAQSLNECDSRKMPRSSVKLREIIQKEFTQSNVKASIQVNSNDEIIVMYLEKKHFTNAPTELLKLVTLEKITCKDIDCISQLGGWKRLVQSLTSTRSMRVVINKQGGEIVIVGLSNPVPYACGNIRAFIRENASGVELVKMEYMHAKFVKDYFKESLVKSRGADAMTHVKWQLQNAGGIEIEGKDSQVKQAVAWLTEINKVIKIEKHEISDVGVPAYFRDAGKSKTFLTLTEKENKCVIMVDSCTLPVWDQKQQDVGAGSKPSTALRTIETFQLQGSNVMMKVVRGDITMVDCDAIVNASNEEHELRNAGISGSILKKGGKSIQDEMTNYKSQKGGLLPGMTMNTGAGNLKFKRIFHTVGPTWNSSSNCEQHLKSCISETLKQAECYTLTSLAIPAISCGVFGGDPVLCTRLIVETIVDHFNVGTSSIKQVCLVENSNTNVLNGFVNTLRTLQSGSRVAQSPSVVQPMPAKIHVSVTNKLMVNFVQGDLANQTVDVIVTATSPQKFANGTGSAVTKSLLRVAGHQLQTTMQQLALCLNLQLGDVQETSGYQLNCQEIYHIMISYYNKSTHSLSKKHLVNGVTTCLQKADSAGYSSIAFPTLGTGGFKYPGTSVARWMHHAINAFTPRSLNTVTIVLYPGNPHNWSFQNEFKSQQTIQSTKAGTVTVNVKQGDITAENSEAIVVPTDVNYDLTGQVAQTLLAKCGPALQTNILNPVARGNNFIMASGSPLFKYIFCIVSGNDQNQLTRELVAIFKQADSAGVRTLSIPAIGGNVGVPSADIARSFSSAIDTYKYSRRRHGNLQQINIVVFQHIMLSYFKHEFPSSTSQQRESVSPPVRVFTAKSASPDKNDDLSDQVTLFICSNQQHNIDKAWKSITDHVRSMTTKKTIDDDIISNITSLEEQEIMDLQRKFNVKIKKTQTNYLRRLVFSGMKDKVQDAYGQAWNILHEFQKALTCAESVMWSCGDTGNTVDFYISDNLKLEEAYKKNPKGRTSICFHFRDGRQTYDVNFPKMQAIVRKTGQTVKVNRNVKGETVLPPTWEDLQGQLWAVFPVNANSTEYNDVLRKFQSGNPFIRNVAKLERIQNAALYKQFLAQEEKVKNKMARAGIKNPVTRELFHGTSTDVCTNIYKDGFDRSHAGKNATAYGKGVYFAVQSNYSHGFTSPGRNGYRTMFLAKVITGEYCQGDHSMITAPTKPGGLKNELYDSVVNDMTNPGMFVVFKDASVYPDYVLTYS